MSSSKNVGHKGMQFKKDGEDDATIDDFCRNNLNIFFHLNEDVKSRNLDIKITFGSTVSFNYDVTTKIKDFYQKNSYLISHLHKEVVKRNLVHINLEITNYGQALRSYGFSNKPSREFESRYQHATIHFHFFSFFLFFFFFFSGSRGGRIGKKDFISSKGAGA